MDKIIFDALKSNQIELLIYTAVIFFIIWLYKEFRTTTIEYEKTTSERIDKSLELYGDLQLEITSYLKNQSDIKTLKQKMSKTYPYLPKNILEFITTWNKDEKNDYLDQISTGLNNEIFYLKSLQFDKVAFKYNNFIENMDHIFNKIRLSTFISPFIYTFVSIILIMFLLAFSITFNKANITNKLLLILLIVNFIFFIIIASFVIENIFKNKFKHSLINWIAFICMIFSPAILLIILKYKFIVPIQTCLVFTYMILFIKKSIHKNT